MKIIVKWLQDSENLRIACKNTNIHLTGYSKKILVKFPLFLIISCELSKEK